MKKFKLRNIIQILFFMLVTLIAVNHNTDLAIPFTSDASLHSICPFGGVASLYQIITSGEFIKDIHMSSFVMTVLIFGLAILFGPVFCSWICPLGTIQEFISKIGKKIFKKKHNTFISMKVHNILKYFRYVVLVFVLYKTYTSAVLVFENIDPFYALFHIGTGEATTLSLIVLSVILIGSLFVERPWCKYMCPLGALLGITNKFRIFSIRRNENTCINCNMCTKSCPMNIDVANKTKITDLQCISCLECTSENSCPIDNTVNLQIGGFKNETK
jgi:polyferredoxin